MQDQVQANEEFTPLTKQKLFDGVVLSKLTGTPVESIEKDDYGYWRKHTYNDSGLELTCETSTGYWRKHTYNNAGMWLTCETSNDYWFKYTYSDAGMWLTYQDSYGTFRQYITHDGTFGLRFEEGRYKAGCRNFSYEKAIEHWTKRSTNEDEETSNRAKLFLQAIAEHHKTQKKEQE